MGVGYGVNEVSTLVKIHISIDKDEIDEHELENWLEDQLQKMQDCNEGITGYAVRSIDNEN